MTAKKKHYVSIADIHCVVALLQRFRERLGQCCLRVAAGPYQPHWPIHATQPMPHSKPLYGRAKANIQTKGPQRAVVSRLNFRFWARVHVISQPSEASSPQWGGTLCRRRVCCCSVISHFSWGRGRKNLWEKDGGADRMKQDGKIYHVCHWTGENMMHSTEYSIISSLFFKNTKGAHKMDFITAI